jgi:hypothetical protein
VAEVEKAEGASQADRIRKFALERWITPARREGKTAITIRAGDVHRAMGLANAMPAVCSALGSQKFASLAGVTLLRTEGPAAGANVYFYFSLFRMPPPELVARVRPVATGSTAKPEINLDLRDSLVLVSCVKSKLPHAASARQLYTSAWFSKVRNLVEESGSPWFILSSRYGLVAPDQEIEPYEYTLNTLGVAERRRWAQEVLDRLRPHLKSHKRVVIFGGTRYSEFLVEPIRAAGIEVALPLERLRRGEQLAWLAEHE